MDIGMLWYDGNKQETLSKRIIKAVAYYKEKYGYNANCVFVAPSDFVVEEQVDGVRIVPSRSIIKSHFWVGIEHEKR